MQGSVGEPTFEGASAGLLYAISAGVLDRVQYTIFPPLKDCIGYQGPSEELHNCCTLSPTRDAQCSSMFCSHAAKMPIIVCDPSITGVWTVSINPVYLFFV